MVRRPSLCMSCAIAALSAVGAAQPALATEDDTQLWMSATASGPVHGRWLASMDIQQRAYDNMSRLANTQVRGAIG